MNNDLETNSVRDKDQSLTPDYSSGFGNELNYEEPTNMKHGYGRHLVQSFKRNPDLTFTPKGVISADGRVFNPDHAAANTANSPLSRRLKGRHLQMIAIGGSIGEQVFKRSQDWSDNFAGTGLFVTSGRALATGGPASLLICFSLIGIMLYCTVHALGEMAVLFPVAGSFSAFSTRFLDPAWGFAMGWK